MDSKHTVIKGLHYSIKPDQTSTEVDTKSSGPEVIKLFSCSTQLSMKFQQVMKTEMLKNKDFSCFETPRCCIYHARYEHDKFRSQLSLVEKKFYNLGAWPEVIKLFFY